MNAKSSAFESELGANDSDYPPVLKSWRNLYVFVFSELAILILLFYAFSRFYQ